MLLSTAAVSLFGEPGEAREPIHQLDKPTTLAKLKTLLEDPSVLKVGHNLKYDLNVLERYGISVKKLADGRISPWLHHELRVGDHLLAAPPAGEFHLESERELLLLSALLLVGSAWAVRGWVAWVGLFNWLPFFWAFWGYQPYLSTAAARRRGRPPRLGGRRYYHRHHREE